MKPPPKITPAMEPNAVEKVAMSIEALVQQQFSESYAQSTQEGVQKVRDSLRSILATFDPKGGMHAVIKASGEIYYVLRSADFTPLDTGDVNTNAFLFTGRVQGLILASFSVLCLEPKPAPKHFGETLKVPAKKDESH